MTNFFQKPVDFSIESSGSYDAEIIAAGSEEKADDQKKKIDQNLSYDLEQDQLPSENIND